MNMMRRKPVCATGVVRVTLTSNIELVDRVRMGTGNGELIELVQRPRWWEFWRVTAWVAYLRAGIRVDMVRPDGKGRAYRGRTLVKALKP